MTDPLECSRFAAQTEKGLSFKVEKVLFTDCRRVRNSASGKYSCQLSSDQRVVVADVAATPRDVDPEFETSTHSVTADHNGARTRRLVTRASQHQSSRFGVRKHPLSIHRDAVDVPQES